MSKSFPITGIKVPPGDTVPERPDVDIWFSKRTSRHESLQLSLLVRALTILMDKNPGDELSFFSIAGIHGQPWRSWDGISRAEDFCAHNRSTFPTWHRPYQLLLEQCIHKTMEEILSSNVRDTISQTEWQHAADSWRFPYWDWTTSKLPDIVVHGNSLEIQTLDGSENTERVRNPFWQFSIPGGRSFQELGANGTGNEAKFNPTRATSKYGILTAKEDPAEPWNSGIQNWSKANEALRLRADDDWQNWKAGGTIAEAVSRMFSPDYHSSWESFATTEYSEKDKDGNLIPTKPGYLSLELIHNKIHRWTGGTSTTRPGAGHMASIGFAAFDPLFWLHHCNVDRLTSIWLLLYPTKFFNSPRSDETGQGDLIPFHRDSNRTAWTSNNARFTEPLGYSYDVLHHRSGQKDEPYLLGIRKAINERYGQVRKQVLKFPNLAGRKNDYIVDVIYDRYGYNDGEAYTIHFFLGPVDGEASLYEEHPNHIDIIYTFSSRVGTATSPSEGEGKPKCENCAKQKADGVLSKGQIILTSALLKEATDANNTELNSLRRDDVNRYLKEHLNWRAVDNNGNEINIEQELPRTKIFALRGIADHYDDSSHLSSYHDYEFLPEPCQGKPGGVESL